MLGLWHGCKCLMNYTWSLLCLTKRRVRCQFQRLHFLNARFRGDTLRQCIYVLYALFAIYTWFHLHGKRSLNFSFSVVLVDLALVVSHMTHMLNEKTIDVSEKLDPAAMWCYPGHQDGRSANTKQDLPFKLPTTYSLPSKFLSLQGWQVQETMRSLMRVVGSPLVSSWF